MTTQGVAQSPVPSGRRTGTPRPGRRTRVAFAPAALLVLVVGLITPAAGQTPETRGYAGRPLADALRDLERRGLKIVFSSELVRRDMRVGTEPRGSNDRQILDELLKPHALDAQSGPGGRLLVVRRREAQPQPAPAGRGHIRGTVVDSRTAAPLSGVIVGLREAALEVVTNADGMFDLADVAAGTQTLFVSLVGYALAKPDVRVPDGGVLDVTIALSDGTGTYSEEVTVTADRFRGAATGVPTAIALNSADLLELRGVLADDPFRAIQTLPGVMTGNDFRSEFSVRGSDFRHIGLSIEGIATDWPIHTVRDDLGAGSVALINGDILETAALMAGAYPQDQPARTGAWLDFTIREGSRARTEARGALSMTGASLVLEGPVGRAARGSWLVSARQSYLQWLLARLNPKGGTTFGFTDAQGKFVFDVTPREQFQLTLIGGRSLLDIERENVNANLIEHGSAYTNMAIVGWRSMRGSNATLTHRFAATGYGFHNDGAVGTVLGDGSSQTLSYRGTISWTARPNTVFQVGARAERRSANRESTRFIGIMGDDLGPRTERVSGSATTASADARLTYSTTRSLAVDGGVLVGYSTTGDRSSAASPWITATVPLGRLTLRTGGGLYRQFPAVDQTSSTFGSTEMSPERARHFDLSVEHRWRDDARLQVSVYDRQERDVLRLEEDEYRSVGNAIVAPSMTPVWRNALAGTSRGVEVLVQRRSANGLGGWVSYAYSKTRYDDRLTGETFASDFDQRHTFNAYAQYRLTPATSVSAKIRFGSNFPIPGYLESRGDQTFVAAARNTLRLPRYARVDVRANHTFNYQTRRLTLFVELINVLGRTNYAPDAPHVILDDGRVLHTTQRLFPFVPTAGLVIEF